MSMEYYPEVGQRVTFIAVRSGQVHVLESEVQDRGEGRLSLSIVDPPALSDGGLISVNYLLGGHQWRAKGVVESAEGNRVSLVLKGNPSRGESRDFIRAQLDLPLVAHALNGKDLESATSEFSRLSPPSSFESIGAQSVNLSGNGIAYDSSTPVTKGTYVGVYMLLSRNSGDEVFGAVGKVVRSKPGANGVEVALFFEGLSEDDQDRLFEYVSAWYHARIHLALSSLTS